LRRRAIVLTGTAAADVSEATEASGYSGGVEPLAFNIDRSFRTLFMLFGRLIYDRRTARPRSPQIGKEKLRLWPFLY